MVRHPDILCTNGAFKVLALGIVLAQVLADQLKPLPAGKPAVCLGWRAGARPTFVSFDAMVLTCASI
jgi:hypothetical protein